MQSRACGFLIAALAIAACARTAPSATEPATIAIAEDAPKDAGGTVIVEPDAEDPAPYAGSADDEAIDAGDWATGVPECDQYLVAWQRCRWDATTRQAARPALRVMRDSWADLATDPSARPALAIGCKAALDQLRTHAACAP